MDIDNDFNPIRLKDIGKSTVQAVEKPRVLNSGIEVQDYWYRSINVNAEIAHPTPHVPPNRSIKNSDVVGNFTGPTPVPYTHMLNPKSYLSIDE